jgi:hypothetical protein
MDIVGSCETLASIDELLNIFILLIEFFNITVALVRSSRGLGTISVFSKLLVTV